MRCRWLLGIGCALFVAAAWTGCAKGVSGFDDDDDDDGVSGGTGGSGGSGGTGGFGGTGLTGGSGGSGNSGGSGGTGLTGGTGGTGATGGTGGTGGTGASSCGAGALPFFESFENGVPPSGWSHIDGSNAYLQWELGYDAYSGLWSAYHDYDWYETDDDILVTPAFDLSGCPGGTAINLVFYEMGSFTSYYEGHFLVYTTNPNPTSLSDFTQIQELGPTGSTWSQRAISLTSLAGQPVVRLGFRYYGFDADTWSIDDVAITAN